MESFSDKNLKMGSDLNDFLKDLDIKATKDFGFTETNNKRKEIGLSLYTKEEYDKKFLEMHQGLITSHEDSIKYNEARIEEIKMQLSQRDEKLKEMNGFLEAAIKRGDSVLIQKWQEMIKKWSEHFDVDKMLEKISFLETHIKTLKSYIEDSAHTISRLNV